MVLSRPKPGAERRLRVWRSRLDVAGDEWRERCISVHGRDPNGYALVTNDLGQTGEHGCILQTFECGQAGLNTSCTVRFDYQVQGFDVLGSHSEVTATVDGDIAFDQLLSVSTPGWSSETVTVPCGTHVLGLCLDVLPGASGDPYWRASFDNVSGTCDTNIGIEPRPWGAVKRLFEG